MAVSNFKNSSIKTGSKRNNFVTPPVSVTVTGGTLTVSGGYNYRVFTGNSDLVVSNGSITADVLVVAGGGGGGCDIGGGGGAVGCRGGA